MPANRYRRQRFSPIARTDPSDTSPHKGWGRPPKPLRQGSYLAMELNTETPIPERDGQVVTVMAEDPVHLTDEGWRFFRPRQEAWYLIRPDAAPRPALGDGLYADLATTKGRIVLVEIGKTCLTPALDEAIGAMRRGERRTVVAPAPLAYGRSGFTAREVPGQKRFVISPNTTLVYEIEVRQ